MEAKGVLASHSTQLAELQATLGAAFKLQQEDRSKNTETSEDGFVYTGSIISGTRNELFQMIQNGNGFEEEENTVITDSMSVTTADEEKVQLLNRNTDLRRVNKELVKLNQEWDHVHRLMTIGMQQRLSVLQEEVSDSNKHAKTLSKKLDNEERKREYYEQSLIQEMKKNQQLQGYIRELENELHSMRERVRGPLEEPWRLGQSSEDSAIVYHHPRTDYEEETTRSANALGIGEKTREHSQSKRSKPEAAHPTASNKISPQEFKDLRDQVAALRCQTKLYEADYKTERKDRQRTQAENEKLKKKTEDLGLQMNLLQEQVKIYEDDFKRERSDKQILQRLLKSKAEPKSLCWSTGVTTPTRNLRRPEEASALTAWSAPYTNTQSAQSIVDSEMPISRSNPIL
ncbi:TNFAIP3-interacting protein 3 [Callorhinchus milii]|uniref:TNFAIP3-interacting protein 3 n=1 Tax=Callorhinchus milii TaxID=7868 RepID=UPI001C3F67DF|nr:TNFAIP3-interacting protein 3 [Callorhinchus milii]